jgi:hypothetical protein
MTRFDKYDVIGMIVLALLAALWIAHFVVPAPPPDPAVITLTRDPGATTHADRDPLATRART